MTTQNITTTKFLSSDLVYSIMLLVLFIILVIQIYTYFNFKYQISKLSLLFGDFTRFYIHASKPPYRNSSNFDLINYVNGKDLSKSESSSESKSCQTENFNKINVVNEIDDIKTSFKSKLRKFKNFPTPVSHPINKSAFTFNQLSAYKPKYLRRHSTFDLINRLGDENSQEKLSKCPNFKFRHSESYSFDLANRIYEQFTDNEFKLNALTNGNKAQVLPQRRTRLYGVSDDHNNGRRYLNSITSTSTPNK